MAIAKKCDICGKLYERYNERENQNKPNGFRLMSIDENKKYYAYKVTDCCPDCMESILQHIERLGGKERMV